MKKKIYIYTALREVWILKKCFRLRNLPTDNCVNIAANTESRNIMTSIFSFMFKRRLKLYEIPPKM